MIVYVMFRKIMGRLVKWNLLLLFGASVNLNTVLAADVSMRPAMAE